ncbi:MAG: hypothetical protein HY059_09835 [Proteobacteria bacterium]|nr:hypothetical protein [Pseudomonadota bacterium]
MSYQVKRIDPYWIVHPMIPVAVVGGAVLGAAGLVADKTPIWIVGGLLMALGVVLGTKIAVSAVLGLLGLIGGLATFVLRPNLQMADVSLAWKLVSAIIFAALYMVLMDAIVLAIAVLYNFFSALSKGISIDIEEDAGTEGEA